jgi:nitrogen fixation protein NifU and related proteins
MMPDTLAHRTHGADESVYREIILEEYKHPRNRGALAGATHTGTVKNPLCGDEITLRLKMRDDVVVDARFDGVGCAVSQAAASLFTEHLKGKNLEEISAMDEKTIIGLLGFAPNPMRMKCAVLPLRAAAGALDIEERTR